MEPSIQLEMLAQGHNFDQWGDILVVAIMAFLWLAAGLAKVITGKKGGQQPRRQDGAATQQGGRRETWQERLARKAREIQKAAEARAGQFEQKTHSDTPAQRQHPTPVSPQPPAGRITIRHGAKGDSVMIYERPASQPFPERRQHTARLRQTAAPASVEPAAKPLHEMPSRIVTPEPPRSRESRPTVSELSSPFISLGPGDIIDYRDPDALKKAVLHYEILGRPLALREPSQETSLF